MKFDTELTHFLYKISIEKHSKQRNIFLSPLFCFIIVQNQREHLQICLGDKNSQIHSLLHNLKQDIETINNNGYIRKIYDRVVTLENDLTKLKAIVQRMIKKRNVLKPVKF